MNGEPMTKITTWFGTIRKAWALAVSATSLWASALLTDGQPGVSGKAWAALIAIWTNVVIVYLIGNEAPPAKNALKVAVDPKALADDLIARLNKPLATGGVIRKPSPADDGVDAQAAGAPPR